LLCRVDFGIGKAILLLHHQKHLCRGRNRLGLLGMWVPVGRVPHLWLQRLCLCR
jgi:hypothetical protein